jgi:choline kinase
LRSDIEVAIPVAGKGSRLGMGLPKCLVPVWGKPIIEWQLESLRALDIKVTVIVGYMADEVIKFVSSLDPLVQFIENSDFETTGTAASVRKAAESVKALSLVSIDGDVLIHPSSLTKILDAADSVLGVTERLTSHGVLVEVNENRVVSFARESDSLFEWSGVFKIATDAAHKFSDGHVYEDLALLLPLRYENIECCEVDTLADLQNAENWMIEMTTGSGGQWKKK